MVIIQNSMLHFHKKLVKENSSVTTSVRHKTEFSVIITSWTFVWDFPKSGSAVVMKAVTEHTGFESDCAGMCHHYFLVYSFLWRWRGAVIDSNQLRKHTMQSLVEEVDFLLKGPLNDILKYCTISFIGCLCQLKLILPAHCPQLGAARKKVWRTGRCCSIKTRAALSD